MRLPIDTSGLTFLCAGAAEPVVDFETKQPKIDETGVPLFAVQLVALAEGGAEVISVKIVGEPKGVSSGQSVKVADLVATPWAMGDRSGVSYRARSLEPIGASSSSSSRSA